MDIGPFFLILGDEETSLENVGSILAGKTGLKLIDVYGKSQEIPGAVVEIDLLNRRIVIA